MLSNEIEPEKFLRGTGGAGSSVITYPGTFKWQPPHEPADAVQFKNLSLRFARNCEGEIAVMEILSGGENAKNIFGESIGKFYDPSKCFLGMEPFAVCLFLRACYSKLVLKKEKERA
jgi:hypothetical protein